MTNSVIELGNHLEVYINNCTTNDRRFDILSLSTNTDSILLGQLVSLVMSYLEVGVSLDLAISRASDVLILTDGKLKGYSVIT